MPDTFTAAAPADNEKVRHITLPARDRAAPFLLAALVALAGLTAFAPAPGLRGVAPSGLLRDFNAFYCAGRSLDAGADPYRAEPLGSCEREFKPAPLMAGTPGLAMPAPLPPYALVPFALLARFTFGIAAILWSLLLLSCTVVTIVGMRRLTGLPATMVTAAFVLSEGYAALCLGQIAPLAVASIVLAARLLAARRDALAGLVAALSMFEPHVGLPVCLALFAWRPRTRVPLLAAALACLAISVAVAGPATTLEYVRAVVPAHAMSEIANEKQLSLTYALHRLGASDGLAVRAGDLWYLGMLVLGIGAAGLALRRGLGAEFVAALPPLFALVGGPFVHVVQMPAALPAALLLYARATGATRAILGVGVAALAVPWIQFANLGTSFDGLAALVCAILTFSMIDRRPLAAAGAAIAAIVFLAAATAAVQTRIGDAGAALAARYDPRALAEASWTTYIAAIGSANAFAFDLAKVPTIVALLALACCALAELRPAKTHERLPTIASTGNGGDASRRIALR